MSERTIFLDAIEIADPAERAAFLDRACGGDADLRSRVDALLAAFAAAGNFLDPPVPPTATAPPDRTNTHDPDGPATDDYAAGGASGQVIAGRYTLLERIGEGGMGEVWVAKQTEPVSRKVAVKLIKPGMDSKQVLARFEAERQALALMDHPNIAKVFDAGATPDGRPYFVMEWVKGVPITEYCDTARLTPRERLELFVPVCQAIQHAHQKGIIHRDIKPSNVLVAVSDDKPVVKVIDFGVAKATGQALTERTIDTGVGGLVGTPQYMSPEQATLNNLDIDTRSDVYSLGVLLYELLTGSPPFSRKELERKGLLEILRVVREEEPPKPSTKLSTADAVATLSANRGTEPRKLTALLRSELDWVVMKALEKDRTRRYETANGFAVDIQRYLAGEAVLAHPPSSSYRLKKFLRKHRGPVLALVLLTVTLVAGVVGTTLGLVEAREQTRLARSEAEAREEARRSEAEQRRLAERANEQAFEALKSFTSELMGKLLGGKDRLTDTDRSILDNARKQWEVFAESQGDSPSARVIRSEGAAELALIQAKLGMRLEAVANDRKALEIRTGLAAEFPDNPLYRLKVGMSHQNLGAALRGNGDRAEAEANFNKAVGVFEQLVAEFPAEPRYRHRLSKAYISLGNSTRDRGDLDGAVGHYRTALGHQEKLVEDHPGVMGYRDSAAGSHWDLAYTMKRLKKYPESEGHYRKALATYTELAARSPDRLDWRRYLGGLHRELGVMLYDSGDDVKGAAEFPAALDVLAKLVAEFPSIPAYRVELARSHRDYGKVLGLLQKPTEAEGQLAAAEDLLEKLVADQPTVLPHQADLGLTYRFHGNLHRSLRAPAASLPWYDKAIRTLTAAHVQDPKHALTKTSLSNAHAERAGTLDDLARHAEAVRDWDRAVDLAPADRLTLFRGLRAVSLYRSGQVSAALADLATLPLGNSTSSEPPPWNAGEWYDFACVYAGASGKVPEKRQEYADRAMDLLRRSVKAGWSDAARAVTDADLDPLRDREDFKEWLASLPAPEPKVSGVEVAPPPRAAKR